jgi:hypothetical protein
MQITEAHFTATIEAVNTAVEAVALAEASGKKPAVKRARVGLENALAAYRTARATMLARDLADRGIAPVPTSVPASLDRAAN